MKQVIEKWGMFEVAVKGKEEGNPFTDYEVKGLFASNMESVETYGFYDGNGIYKVRFMPSFEGEYKFKIYGSFSDEVFEGCFTADKPGLYNHGPVSVSNTHHFVYADGTPYYSIGTTCYGWVHQNETLQKETINTLGNTYFNKIRFCILPKHYDYNYRDPIMFPYEGTPVDNSGINKFNFEEYTPENTGNHWDFARFNADYFQMIDKAVERLMNLGIEADIILMHPYDRWGFSNMPQWADDLYLKYVTARLSAYRNVWWSLANEYDLCKYKSTEDWEHYAGIVTENDKFKHLISIHNCVKQYDFTRPWVTHCSIQRQVGENELDNIYQWLKTYKKPIVIDEMCYEGNIEQYWGNISAQEMLRRMWKTVILGGYPGHSECYMGDNIWWSHGGRLRGESYKKLGFLHDMLTETGALHPTGYTSAANDDESVLLWYFGEHRPSFYTFKLGDISYRLEVIDTWNMTTDDRGIVNGNLTVDLPGREYMAVKLTRIQEGI